MINMLVSQRPLNFSVWSSTCVSRHSPWTTLKMLRNDRCHSWGSPTHWLFRTDIFGTMRGRGRTLGAAHREGLSWLINLGEMAKSWFQVNHERRTKRVLICSPASLAKGSTWHPVCLAPSEGHMNWSISHQSPAGYITLRSFCYHLI